MSDSPTQELQRLAGDARRFGVSLSPQQLGRMGTFLDVLWAWNRKMNLTGASNRARILEELILDSLVPLAYLPESRRLLDVGTGAGFPGIPLKICRPHMRLHLLESNAKKVSFLKEAVRHVGLQGVDIFHERLEHMFGPDTPAAYRLVTARAVAPMAKTVSWCAGLLADGGRLVTFQGENVDAALGAACEEIERRRLGVEHIIPYRLPGKRNRRHILILQRKGKASI